MADHVYKLIKIAGTSTTTIEDAVFEAMHRAHENLNCLSMFQVIDTQTNIDSEKTLHWQVTVKVASPGRSQSGQLREAVQFA